MNTAFKKNEAAQRVAREAFFRNEEAPKIFGVNMERELSKVGTIVLRDRKRGSRRTGAWRSR